MAAVEIASRQKSSTSAGGPTDRPKPTDSTRYLCAAVYFDRKFRNRVIREIVDEEQRAIGTSPGLDLVMVVEHALAVSRRKFRRDIWLALLLFVVLVLGAFAAARFVLVVAALTAFAIVLADRWNDLQILARSLTKGRVAVHAPGFSPTPHQAEKLRQLDVAQHGNVVVYSGYSPFVGSGYQVSGWSLAVNLSRGADHLGVTSDPEAFEVGEVYDFVNAALRELGFIGLALEDKLFVNGQEIRDDRIFLPDPHTRPIHELEASLIRAFLENPTQSIRHYKTVRVVSWKGELVLSIFLRFTRIGPSLFVEASCFLLPPLKEEYHKVDSLQPTLTLRNRLDVIQRSLLATPLLFLGSWFRLLGRAYQPILRRQARQATRAAIRENFMFDYGCAQSLREAASSTAVRQYFQFLDKEMYLKAIERQILDALVEFLKSKNIDTSDLKASQQTILNTGVVVSGGSVTAENLSVGAGARVTQAVTRAAAGFALGGAPASAQSTKK